MVWAVELILWNLGKIRRVKDVGPKSAPYETSKRVPMLLRGGEGNPKP